MNYQQAKRPLTKHPQTHPPRRTLLKTAAGAAAASFVPLGAKAAVAHKPQDRIKIGQIGVGHAHAGGKMNTMRKMSDRYEVVGVVEPNPLLRQRAQENKTYQGVKWMTDEELLNTPGLQAVAVETEVRNLLLTAAKCIAAGVHIHLDKPAGESLSEFEKIMNEAVRKKLTVQMGYMFRYNPAFVFLFDAVRKGWLGEVFEAHTVMSKTVNAATRKRLAEYPGGSMFELGCHVIDALVYALGEPKKVSPFVRRTRTEQDDLADNQLAVFEYEEATATVRSAVVEVEGGQRRQFVVCGDQGTIDIRPLEPPQLRLALNAVRGKYRPGYQDVKLTNLEGRYDGDFDDLAKIIRQEKELAFSPRHDLAVQKAVLQASGLRLN